MLLLNADEMDGRKVKNKYVPAAAAAGVEKRFPRPESRLRIANPYGQRTVHPHVVCDSKTEPCGAPIVEQFHSDIKFENVSRIAR